MTGPPPAAVVAEILTIARQVLGLPVLGADDDLVAAGATSLAMLRIVATACRSLGIDIAPGSLGGAPVTVNVLARAATTAGPLRP